jgi:hypothetical protein
VRTAPGVQRVGQVLVLGVAVADDRAPVPGKHAAGVDILRGPAAGMHRGEELGAGHVHIVQAPAGAGRSLIGIQLDAGTPAAWVTATRCTAATRACALTWKDAR